MEADIRRQFQQYFGKDHQMSVAPGRVNLIGEHTDYNQGYVLPAAIDKKIYIGHTSNSNSNLNVRALEYNEQFTFSLEDMRPVKGWPTYLLGMIHILMPEHRLPYGIDVIVSGNVPVGAGMSSSAALCSAFGLALNQRFQLGLSRMQIALAGQKTEHVFASLQCGIMDQFASLHGKADHLMKLDCRSLEYEYIPFDFPDHQIVLVNTMVSHNLAGSQYNLRRQQCEAGVSVLRQYYPGVLSLRDVQLSQLLEHRKQINETDFKRCRFIVEENQRLLDGCGFLKEKNLSAFGDLMYASHRGLSNDYEVSCKESDFLVDNIRHMRGVKGARQMGGGFGGCIIVLLEKKITEEFKSEIQLRYENEFSKTPDCYEMNISEGAHIIISEAQ